jgi:CO dehydrogenase maturation factor
MRIAFVGKGGSGKTTLTALFANFVAKKTRESIVIFDADMNIHVGDLLGFKDLESLPHLSSNDVQNDIKKYIKANNPRIETLSHIKKTTPPTEDSGYLHLSDGKNFLFSKYAKEKDGMYLSVVGAYDAEGIGKSCYHNSLAILENILAHSIDTHAYIIADMVAGVDAFAGSLHAQFDILVLNIEPTKRSVAVYEQYAELAKHAGIFDQLYVIGNKIEDSDDEKFILETIPQDKYIGSIQSSNHMRNVDKGKENLESPLLDDASQVTLEKIYNTLKQNRRSYNNRLQHLVNLHRKYTAQDYIVDRVGDLTGQIQEDFDFDAFVKEHYGS